MAYLNKKSKERIINYISDLVDSALHCGFKQGAGLSSDEVNFYVKRCAFLKQLLEDYILSC